MQTSAAEQSEPDDSAYISRVEQIAVKKWFPPKNMSSQASAVIDFNINLDGSASSIKIHKSSGNKEADNSAITAVKNGAPYPSPPARYHKWKSPLIMRLTFNKKNHNSIMKINGQDVFNKNIQLSGGSKMSFSKVDSNIDQKLHSSKIVLSERISALENEIRTKEKISNLEDSHDTTRLIELSKLYSQIQDRSASEHILLRAVNLLDNSNKPSEYVRATTALAENYSALNKLNEADKWSERAYALATRCADLEDQDKQFLLKLRAQTLYKLGRQTEANKVYAELNTLNSKLYLQIPNRGNRI